MNALLLPGNSPRHEQWVEQLKTALEPHFDTIKTQYYAHWKTGDEWANVDQEITAARRNTENLEPYVIFGKSIGTVIATKAVATHQLTAEKLILMGIPINRGADPVEVASWLSSINIPVTIIQNTTDPMGSFTDVKNAFESSSDTLTFVERPGDTHDYVDFDAIAQLI